jgi:hypothetical protein
MSLWVEFPAQANPIEVCKPLQRVSEIALFSAGCSSFQPVSFQITIIVLYPRMKIATGRGGLAFGNRCFENQFLTQRR